MQKKFTELWLDILSSFLSDTKDLSFFYELWIPIHRPVAESDDIAILSYYEPEKQLLWLETFRKLLESKKNSKEENWKTFLFDLRGNIIQMHSTRAQIKQRIEVDLKSQSNAWEWRTRETTDTTGGLFSWMKKNWTSESNLAFPMKILLFTMKNPSPPSSSSSSSQVVQDEHQIFLCFYFPYITQQNGPVLCMNPKHSIEEQKIYNPLGANLPTPFLVDFETKGNYYSEFAPFEQEQVVSILIKKIYATIHSHCFQCWESETKEKPFSRCGQCRDARYCSKTCQTSHWTKHKMYCKKKKIKCLNIYFQWQSLDKCFQFGY